MTDFSVLRRLAARVLAPVALTAALLAACGGGTSQVAAFHPARLVVFGDENSVIEDDGSNDGLKYSINDRSSGTAGRCNSLPIFVQGVASLYGFVFEQCNPTGNTPRAFIRALRLAKVDDASTGLNAQMASQDGLNQQDMVSVMIGSNDVIDLYESVQSGLSRGDAIAEARRRGGRVAEFVNSVLKTGARALVFTIPDMGLSPYAVNANQFDPGAAKLLAELSYEFNAHLRVGIDSDTYDGRNYGLVLVDDVVGAMAAAPTAFLSSPSNTNAAACAMPTDTSADSVAKAVLACTTTTLVDGAGANSHLWASDRHLGPAAHSRISAQAQSRALGNPF
jgi:hypothetical protein